MRDPRHAFFQPYLSRLLLGGALGLSVILLACGLTLLGAIWLVQGLTLWLSMHVGDAAAHAISGALCILPLALVVLRLWRLSRMPAQPLRHAGDTLRDMVRENPWEAMGVAFLMGVTQHGQHQDRLVVLREHLHAMRRDKVDAANDAPDTNDHAQP